MGFSRGRVKRLEKGRSGVCPECKLPPDGHVYLVLINEERPEKSFEGDTEERCGSCGRHLYTVIRVVYEDAEGGGG